MMATVSHRLESFVLQLFFQSVGRFGFFQLFDDGA